MNFLWYTQLSLSVIDNMDSLVPRSSTLLGQLWWLLATMMMTIYDDYDDDGGDDDDDSLVNWVREGFPLLFPRSSAFNA